MENKRIENINYINKEIINTINQIEDLYLENYKNITIVNENNSISTKNSKIQNLYSLNSKFKENNNIIGNLLLNSIIDIERTFYNSSEIYLNILKNKYLNTLNKLNIENLSINKDLIKDILNIDLSIGNRFSSIILNLLEQSNKDSVFILEKIDSDNISVEFNKGFIVKCNINNILHRENEINDVYVIPVDGMIESISEINLLLESASKTKDNILICCRAVANDVLSTLKLNLFRKSFNVNLALFPFEIENLNSLKDISVISNNDLVSSLKGETFKSINSYKKFGKINKVIFKNNSIIFSTENKHTDQLKAHIGFLKNQFNYLSQEHDIEKFKIIKNRFNAFNSNTITIKIPEHIDHSIFENINDFFKLLSFLLEHTSIQKIKLNNKNFYTSSKVIEKINSTTENLLSYLKNINFIIL